MRRNYFIWAGIYRAVTKRRWRGGNKYDDSGWLGEANFPTLVIDVDLLSWALPIAVHGGGPILERPGFHVRILCVNIGWSKL